MVKKTFSVDGKSYEVTIGDDYEIAFSSLSVGLDKFGKAKNGYNRTKHNSNTHAITVYRVVLKFVSEWIYTHKPPYVKWNCGFDMSRKSLYDRFAKKLKRLNYNVVNDPDNPNYYFAYKIK